MNFNTHKMKPTRHAVKFYTCLISKNTPESHDHDHDHPKPFNSAIYVVKHCESTSLTPGILHDIT